LDASGYRDSPATAGLPISVGDACAPSAQCLHKNASVRGPREGWTAATSAIGIGVEVLIAPTNGAREGF